MMSLSGLFGGGESTDALKNWQSPFVNAESFNSALGSLSNPTSLLTGFTGGGLTGGYDASGNAFVTADPSRSAMVSQLGSVYGDQLSKLNDLAAKIAPGYSELRAAQLGDLESQQTKAISDLRANLESRRVLGSSFAQDALTRANAEFSKQRSEVTSSTYLKELEATNSIIQQQAEAGANQVQTALNESNLEAGIAGQLGQQATQIISAATQLKARLIAELAKDAQSQMASNLRTAAQIDESANSGAGSFFGSLLTPLVTSITGPIGGAISSGITSALA